MCMLKGRCKRFHPDYLIEGARRDGVYWFGTQSTKAGVDYQYGLDYVKKLYQSVMRLVGKDDIDFEVLARKS